MTDHEPNRHGWRRRITIITAFILLLAPCALYYKYLKKAPLNPVTGVLHLFWSSDGEQFDKSRDIYTVTRTLTGEREKLVFEFSEPISFKRLRVDPLVAQEGVVTFYELRVYEAKGKMTLRVVFDARTADWMCADCTPGKPRSGWQLFTHGSLAVASPIFPETKAERIELELKAIPWDEAIDFLSWVADKYF